MKAAQTHLVPLQELTPGMITEIRNSVISRLVDLASKELSLPPDRLIVRDILPFTDLDWEFSTTSATGAEGWERNMTESSVGYVSVAAGNMTNQRFVAIFGIRDGRVGEGASATAITAAIPIPATGVGGGDKLYHQPISLVKFTIGGGIRAIWDISCTNAYDDMVAFSPSAVIIPQNSAFDVSFYKKDTVGGGASSAEVPVFLQMAGVTVEPRGKLISA